jgi:hypothetical protein
VLINDPTLIGQLTSRKTTYDMRGRLGIEKKDDMAARGVKSPDRADAVIGAFSHGVSDFAIFMKRMDDPWERKLEEAYEGFAPAMDRSTEQQLEDLGAWTG